MTPSVGRDRPCSCKLPFPRLLWSQERLTTGQAPRPFRLYRKRRWHLQGALRSKARSMGSGPSADACLGASRDPPPSRTTPLLPASRFYGPGNWSLLFYSMIADLIRGGLSFSLKVSCCAVDLLRVTGNLLQLLLLSVLRSLFHFYPFWHHIHFF